MTKEKLKEMFLADWPPCVKGLILADALLFGVLVGWLTSPLKQGIRIFSNNQLDLGNQGDGDKEEEE